MRARVLSDAAAKEMLRSWPERTRALWHPALGSGYWLRALPKVGAVPCPKLQLPGRALFATQPDGLWAYIKPDEFADVIVIEVCGTAQNLNDKRSRYFPTGAALLLKLPQSWLLESIQIQSGTPKARWKAFATFPPDASAPEEDLRLPVRFLRVLYALPNDLYDRWIVSSTCAAHEFYCRHSSLGNHRAPATRSFLRRLSPDSHYLGT